MGQIRKGFYLVVGFTFPGFWACHAEGFLSYYYVPIQRIVSTISLGWASLISASLLYLGSIILFEICYWLLRKYHP